MQKNWEFLLLVAALFMLLSGCITNPSLERSAALSARGTFAEQRFVTPHFVLYGLLRPGQPGKGDVLHVYVEGDGNSWTRQRRPTSNPTPFEDVALRLAEADPSLGPVLYLARPCQYVQGPDARQCRRLYWTSGRLGEPVIASLDAAIDQAKQRSGARSVVLVGYSGGGGAVTMLAARRQDVDFFASVAGVLDHKAWTEFHRVDPLTDSLPPVQANALRHVPQRHMTSGSDTVVPPVVNAAYCRGAVQGVCVEAPATPRMVHSGVWERVWNYDYR